MPIRIVVSPQCSRNNNFFSLSQNLIVLGAYPPCSWDFESVLYHELTHAVEQHAMPSRRFDSDIDHDPTIRDPADHQLLLVMDARTSPDHALDEGLASAVSLVVQPRNSRYTPYLNMIAQESRSSSWQQVPWRDQQANEYFVMAVLAAFLSDPDAAGAYDRLDHILEVFRTRQPNNFEALLMGLMDRDPVRDKDHIDAALRRFHSHWDSEVWDRQRAARESGH
jgi:hypothetical protein